MKVYSAPIPKQYLPYAAVTLAHIVHSRTLITHVTDVEEITIHICEDEDGTYYWRVTYVVGGTIENKRGIASYVLARDALRGFSNKVEQLLCAYPAMFWEEMQISDAIASLQDAINNEKPSATWALDLLDKGEV